MRFILLRKFNLTLVLSFGYIGMQYYEGNYEEYTKRNHDMDLSELNSLIDFIRDVQNMNVKSSLVEGQKCM